MERKMKNRKKRRKGEEGLAAQPLGPASPVRARRPSKQAQATAAARAPSPASCRCHLGPRVSRALFTRTPLFPSPQSLPANPARQPSPAHLPHAAPNRQPTGGRQRVQSGPGGHARAMALPPLAQRPRQCHANHPRPASRSMRSARSSAVRRGARSTGYKSPSPRALAIVHHPPPFGGHTLCTGTKREEGEGEGRRGRKRRSRREGGGRRSRRRRRRFVTDVARHGTARPHRSCTASHRHGTAILSPTTPTVSLPVSPYSSSDHTMPAMALHTRSA